MNRYSIQILEYANTDSAPVSGQIASAHNGGFMNLTMSYQLIEGNGHKILDRKSTRLNSSHIQKSRMPSSA